MLILGSVLVTLTAIVFVGVCGIMILAILIQRPRGGGLAGAFGGAGGSAQTAFGAKTGDVLTWFTVGCFVAFLVLSMLLTWWIKPTPTVQPVIEQPIGAPAQPALPANGASTAPGDGAATGQDPGAATLPAEDAAAPAVPAIPGPENL